MTAKQLEAARAALRSIALPDICTVPVLAQHLHLSHSAIRSLIRQGAIPGRKLGRQWVVSRIELLGSLRTEVPNGDA